ncbi:MAG: polymorphic toxin type 23 domain-containing protein [Bacteroidia bacterium]|nr:polymorphic toxin type 23 domain-containing protein [Bacteroidia bacterium]
MAKKINFLVIFFSIGISLAQNIFRPGNHAGIFPGISISAGTHVIRFGVRCLAFINAGRFEFKTEQRFYVNLMTWGPPQSSVEWIATIGLSGFWGELTNSSGFYNNFQIYHSQSPYKNSLGYAINFYIINNQTSQFTGLIWLNIRQFSFITENDILAHKFLDRYRTGSFAFLWRINQYHEIFIKNILWTGAYGKKVISDNPHFRLGCYLDTTGSKFLRYSAGILSAGFNLQSGQGTLFSFSAGLDHEKIRNFIQNKLIHDMIFLPKPFLKKSQNCHMPMISENGDLFLYLKDQRIRRGKIYLQTAINETIFY